MLANAYSPTKRAKPAQPHTPHRTATASQRPGKAGLLGALSNLSAQSGGTPPGGQGQQQQGQTAGWESDPILQSYLALQQSNMAAAEAQAGAARAQALINFGYDPQMESLYGDPQTAGSAKANPYSVLAQLQHNHEGRQRGINESDNKANLWYSTARANHLGEESHTYLGEQAGAHSTLTGILSGISGGLLAAHQGSDEGVVGARESAYGRWLDQQGHYGLGDPGGTAASSPLRTAVAAPHPVARPKRTVLAPNYAQRRP